MNKNNFGRKTILAGLGAVIISASYNCNSIQHILTNPSISHVAKKNLESKLDSNFYKLDVNTDIKLDVSGMRAELLKPVLDIRVVGGDTLDLTYERSSSIDSSMIEHNKIVVENAKQKYHESRPYLEYIIAACDEFRDIFRIAPETMIGLFIRESDFDPYVVSPARAWGIGQFLRGTAIDMKMKVFSKTDYPKLVSLEDEIVALQAKYKSLDKQANNYFTNFSKHDFNKAIAYRLNADSTSAQLNTAIKSFQNKLSEIGIKKLDDDRLRPEIAIRMSVKYLAALAKRFKKEKHCSDNQAISWAIEAYNGGYEAVIKKSMIYLETYRYERGIHNIECTLYPYDMDNKPYVASKKISKNVPSSKPPSNYVNNSSKISKKNARMYTYSGATPDSTRFYNSRKF